MCAGLYVYMSTAAQGSQKMASESPGAKVTGGLCSVCAQNRT